MKTELKFKVGDRVRVRSLEWYDSNKNVHGDIYNTIEQNVFVRKMAQYCGKALNIVRIKNDFYVVKENIFCWQDWMLESKAVAEEKQEVEQLNKIEMETKKMTLKEAQEFVRNTKYIVWSEDESRKLQKKLFKIGCGWLCGEPIVSHTENPFLFVDKDLRMTFARKESYGSFEESKKIYHLKDDIFNIKIKEQPKPKFNPNTLKTFDKVLVRQNEKSAWLARFYEYSDNVDFHVTNGGAWKFCIPYNDDTMHLHRTCDEAPEFYKLD